VRPQARETAGHYDMAETKLVFTRNKEERNTQVPEDGQEI
jgi:hypothetical protein